MKKLSFLLLAVALVFSSCETRTAKRLREEREGVVKVEVVRENNSSTARLKLESIGGHQYAVYNWNGAAMEHHAGCDGVHK